MSFATGLAHAKEIRTLTAEASSWKSWGAPALLVDGDTATAWVGGRQGVGPGKTLSFTLPKPTTIAMIRIANGNQGEGLFQEFRCITKGILVLQDQAVHHFTLKAEPGEQAIVFAPAKVDSFSIIIEEVSEASSRTDQSRDKVAVSEVRVFSDSQGAAPTVFASPQPSQKKQAAPAKPGTNSSDFFSATKPGRLLLQAVVPAKSGVAPTPGIRDNSVPEEFIRLVQHYFERLNRLQDDYGRVFSSDIHAREESALAQFRETMRSHKLYDSFIKATPDTRGLSFDKPIVRGNAAMLRAHGIYRFTSGAKAYETPVNLLISFTKEGGTWFINGVQQKR